MIYKVEPTNYTITLRATHTKERYPIAYASIAIEELDGKKVGKLGGMIRRNEFKGHGICFDLVTRRINICKSLGCSQVYSAVYYKREGLIKIYESLGFREIEPLTKEYRRFIKEI